MRYVRAEEWPHPRYKVPALDTFGSIHVSGSVTGMQRYYNWKRGGQVRVGQFIYNVGVDIVTRLDELSVLRGR